MRRVAKVVIVVAVILMCAVSWQPASSQPHDGAVSDEDGSGGGGAHAEVVCPSIDVRNNVSAFDKLVNCTVVEGSLQIVLLEKSTPNDFVNLTFPKLREITQYMVVYRVFGLKSLGQLFPNLAIIRGTTLFAKTALAIYENIRLQDIGLRSLTHILKGSVIIFNNYNACFVKSIDWNVIMKSKNANQTYYELLIGRNKETRDCNDEQTCKDAGCERSRCWSKSHCQILQLNNCHPLCAGGCYKPNSAFDCHACQELIANNGECVTACPDQSYEYQKRRCVTAEQCRNFSGPVPKQDKTDNEVLEGKPQNGSYFVLEKWCLNECPSKYYQNPDTQKCSRCEGRCPLDCRPPKNYLNFTIQTPSEARQLQSCTRLLSSLIIDNMSSNFSGAIESSLEEYLGGITEIHGELKIIRSNALVSLNFLRSLHTIRASHSNLSYVGGTGGPSRYGLYVRENQNLHQLWDWSRKPNSTIKIELGKIFFHFNPRLCVSEIDKLVQKANLPELDRYDVSHESNGDKAECKPIPMDVEIDKIESRSVILKITVWTVSTMEKPTNATIHGRFMVFYKPNEGELLLNHTLKFESISDCGQSVWRHSSDLSFHSAEQPYSFILTHLEPAVEYVYFIRSMHSSLSNGRLDKFTTKPDQPTPPLNLKVNFTTQSTVGLSWQPPYHSHGTLFKYVIRGYWETDIRSDLLMRDYCVHKMKKETLVSKPVTTTTTTTTTMTPITGSGGVATVETDCNCPNNTQKDRAQDCNQFEHETNMLTGISEVGMEYCDSYFRNFIRSQELMLHSDPDAFDYMNRTPNSETEFLPAPAANRSGSDGRFEEFSLEVDASHPFVIVENLRHFSQYIVKVVACLREQPGLSKPCSEDTVLAVRTESDPNADRVDESRLVVVTLNQTTNITWLEPTLVNSFVHSYELSYRNKDIENSKYTEVCLSRQKFEATNQTLGLNLAPGHYLLRLRALSLAGEGPYVTKSFEVIESAEDYMSIGISLLIVVVIIAAIFVAFLFYWRAQIKKNRVLFASVNPRYEPIYLADHWEVARENLTLVKQLGRGTFGSVHEGILQPDNIKCAVKTVSAISDEDNMIFLKEATLMKEFHAAYHIVKLIGVISKGTPVYVIMELMEHGDLKSFLLRYGRQYCGENEKTLPDGMVLKMAAEIADGMAFLEAKKFVHRDLAARNCMVAADNTIKIGDFGLARDIYETDYYRKGDKGTLPIRWMAPESIRDGIFTSHSDMWSFGVVLWEITTLAQMPYHPRTNEEVIKYVQSGQTLEVPDNMHEVLRPLMKHCWRWHASHRPKFVQVLRILDAYVDHAFRRVSFFHNGENSDDAANVVPCHSRNEECYIYSDENDKIDLYLGQSPSTSSTFTGSSSVKYMRYVPYRVPAHAENAR